jgi:hypothetical protein
LPPALRWLILTDNAIAALPSTIGCCTQLQKLMLAGNALCALPDELAACTQLALLRIAANQVTVLPDWLLAMPQLAWLAYAGNPIAGAAVTRHAHATIAWGRLQIGRQLGEGASGIIHQAVLQDTGVQAATGPRAVAVKLFKGAITSDGLPACELAACMDAGSHPNLIPVLGEIAGHPDAIHGCVMALVDPAYQNLAGPPSLDSCTRDVYPAGKAFTLDALLRLAGGMASAAHQLHGRGILHGDLYGHNILHTSTGDALLGDFGAASRFGADDPQATALQRLEVRAFGLLLGELLARCKPSSSGSSGSSINSTSSNSGSGSGVLDRLARLHDACVQSATAARPLFGDILRQLEALQTS